MPKPGTTLERMHGGAIVVPKRGRPTADQSAAIDRAIRDVAVQSFLSKGYERTSMEAVAAFAGIPKTTLYKRFPDKRALLRGILKDRVSTWCLRQGEQDAGLNLETRLKHLATEILRQAVTPEVQAFWSLVSTAWSGPHEAAERQEAIGYTKIVDGLEREIRQYGPASGVVARAPRQVAVVLMTMLCGWIEYVAPALPSADEEAPHFAESAVDMLMRGSSAW